MLLCIKQEQEINFNLTWHACKCHNYVLVPDLKEEITTVDFAFIGVQDVWVFSRRLSPCPRKSVPIRAFFLGK